MYRIHNQSTIHKDSEWTSQRAKGILLKLRASERNAFERYASEATSLKKALLKTRHQKQGHQKQGYQKHLIRSHFTRVDKVQCTKCTTTNSAHASATNISATCLHIKTRITVILLQTLFRFKWNGFEISSSLDNYQIRKKINGEESKLQERQVDVTTNSQRLSNPL